MKKLVVSTRKGLIIYHQTNAAWEFDSLHFNGIPVSLSYFDVHTNTLWSFEDHGHWGVKMHKTTNWGKDWEEVAAPKYPEDAVLKEGEKASLNYIWAANSCVTKEGQHLLMLGTDPGGLFISKDNGSSFELNEALWNQESRLKEWFGGGRKDPGIHSIVVDPRDPEHIYTGISCAGVYETLDGGNSWVIRNKGLRADFLPNPYAEVGHDPHLLLASPSNPDVLWQQNHCGIFKSSDGGKQWTDLSEENGPANFGFAIATDYSDSNVAYVAPCVSDEIRVAVDHALCISKTTDGGKNWIALRNGLPQENSFDIVYRHALQSNGNDVVFGTTTGNVYHSKNGGEQWEVLTHNLSMVYALEIVSDVKV